MHSGQKREKVLRKIVEKRIQPYVDGDKEGFIQEIHREADKLAATPFGVPLMHIIAYVSCSLLPCCNQAPRERLSCTSVYTSLVMCKLLPRKLLTDISCMLPDILSKWNRCRYAYARAAKPSLGYAIAEFFTRLGHTITGSVSFQPEPNVAAQFVSLCSQL